MKTKEYMTKFGKIIVAEDTSLKSKILDVLLFPLLIIMAIYAGIKDAQIKQAIRDGSYQDKIKSGKL